MNIENKKPKQHSLNYLLSFFENTIEWKIKEEKKSLYLRKYERKKNDIKQEWEVVNIIKSEEINFLWAVILPEQNQDCDLEKRKRKKNLLWWKAGNLNYLYH